MLKFENVTKRYGDKTLFEDLSFETGKSGVYAVLGKKDAGRSALMKIAAGCDMPDAGRVSLAGADVYEDVLAAKRKISYLPERNCFFPEMTTFEFLIFIGDAKGVNRDKLYKKIDEVVEIAGLEDLTGRIVKNLDDVSLKRLGLAAAVIGNPALILFDGLFENIPRGKTGEFKTLVRMFGEMKPVLVGLSGASNVLEICDGVIDIAANRLILSSELPRGVSLAEHFAAVRSEEREDSAKKITNTDESKGETV